MARACSGIKNPSSAFWAAAITIVAAAGFAEKAQAQWIDAATGKPVASGPMLAQKSYPGGGVRPGIEAGKLEGIPPNADDPNHAFDPVSGRNFFFDRRTCQWKDSATGQVVPSGPMLAQKSYPGGGVRPGVEGGKLEGIKANVGDPNHAFDPVSGRNFVLDCKPAETTHATTAPPPPSVRATPQVGMAIEPHIGAGLQNNLYRPGGEVSARTDAPNNIPGRKDSIPTPQVHVFPGQVSPVIINSGSGLSLREQTPSDTPNKEAQTELPPPALAPAEVIEKETQTEVPPPTLAPAEVIKPADSKTKKTDSKTPGLEMGMRDGSLGNDLYYEGIPEELVGAVKSEDFAEAARKDWDAMSKALDKGSKEDFDKTVGEIKNLSDAAESRWALRLHEVREFREQHADAIKHLRKGKIEDEDVDVLKRYEELEARKQQALDDLDHIERLKKLADHSWKEWSEFWERNRAWEKEHTGKSGIGKRGKDSPTDEAKKTHEKPRKPAQTETKKTKSAKKRRIKKREEEEADVDPAAVEIGVGIATSILGTQMGGHLGHSRREHGNAHSGGMKRTTTSSRRTTTRTSKSTKSGSGGSGTTVNTRVGAPTITFGGGGMGF